MVLFTPTNSPESPSDRTWKALDGLQPRHLKVCCGNMEECWMELLNKLKVPWPLNTLEISEMAMETPGNVWPNACRSVESLTLDCYCRMCWEPSMAASSEDHFIPDRRFF